MDQITDGIFEGQTQIKPLCSEENQLFLSVIMDMVKTFVILWFLGRCDLDGSHWLPETPNHKNYLCFSDYSIYFKSNHN